MISVGHGLQENSFVDRFSAEKFITKPIKLT